MFNIKALAPGAVPTKVAAKTMSTLAGHMTTEGKVKLEGIRLPEFDRNRVVLEQDFNTFSAPCQYNLILGADFLKNAGVKLDYEKLEIEWAGVKLPMNTNKFTRQRLNALADQYLMQIEEELLELENRDECCYAPEILEAKYEPASPDQIITENCSHLNNSKQQDLHNLFVQSSKLFDGELRIFDGPKLDIEIEPGAKTPWKRAYPCPQVHKETFKKELEHR